MLSVVGYSSIEIFVHRVASCFSWGWVRERKTKTATEKERRVIET